MNVTPISPYDFLLNSQSSSLRGTDPLFTLETDSGVKCSEGTKMSKAGGADRGDHSWLSLRVRTSYLVGRGRQGEWRQCGTGEPVSQSLRRSRFRLYSGLLEGLSESYWAVNSGAPSPHLPSADRILAAHANRL